jgi:hypothetical protein
MDVWTVAKARAASILIGAAGALLVGSGCQRSPDAEGEGRAVVLATDPMQFESVNDWRVTQGHAPERAITSVRTQGAGALALTAPSAHTRLESKPIASTNPRLGAIDVGAKLLLDFLLPVEQHDPFWFGSVEVSLTVPSRRVLDASLGRVELTGIRTGIFTTLRFGVPDAVALALEGASYGDLTFAITVHAPKLPSGAYVLDNLRFKAGHLPPRPTSGADIAAGASILLEASKAYSPPADSPASHAFSTGIIQVPQAFHVVQGKAGSGSATFEYRIGSAATVVCTYPAAGGDGSTYAFGSCSGEARAGDLVPADFVRLAIVNGDPAAGKTKVKAQIALNPVGDEMVAGLPPIPTFFGSTAAEVRDALDAFVQQQRSWQISEVELVTLPTPAIPATPLVIRNGTVISPPPPGDPQFPLSGRLTNSDLADAGWHVTGGLAGPIDASTRDTDFHVDMGVDVWLLGFNITDVLGISGSVTTHTEPFDGEHPPTTTELATFCHQYFGFGGSCVGPFDRTDGLDQLIVSTEPNITLFDIDYWLFNVTGTARLTLEARATGNFAGAGFNVGIEPQIGAVMRVRGELGAGPFAGAGLFADFTLIDFSPAISASVTTTLNADPRVCSVHVKETFSGTVTVHTGGGAIGYFVEGGACCGCFVEICWRDEGNLYTWPSDTTSSPRPRWPTRTLPSTPRCARRRETPRAASPIHGWGRASGRATSRSSTPRSRATFSTNRRASSSPRRWIAGPSPGSPMVPTTSSRSPSPRTPPMAPPATPRSGTAAPGRGL